MVLLLGSITELHFANLINDPENLLKEGKALGLPLPDQKLFVAVGERTAVNKLGYLSWIGKGKSPLDTATLILSPEGEVGGTLRVEGSIYQFEPLGEGLRSEERRVGKEGGARWSM